MQTTSREAYEATLAHLERVASDLDGEGLQRLADELWSSARLFASEPRLRVALVDASQPESARHRLLEELVGAQLSADTLALLKGAIGQRWSTPHDLIDATELLSVEAELFASEQRDELGELEDELFRFLRTVEANPELESLLEDATGDSTAKQRLDQELLGEKALAATVWLANRAVTGLGSRGFDASLERLVELVAAHRGRQVAYVTAAAPLRPEHEEQLSQSLTRMYKRPVTLKVDIDPGVLGGVVVRVKDDVYDGSVARRVEKARSALAG